MRHLLMDPAFPDLVAATAAEEANEPGLNGRPRLAPGESQAEMPEIVAEALRLLARLW